MRNPDTSNPGTRRRTRALCASGALILVSLLGGGSVLAADAPAPASTLDATMPGVSSPVSASSLYNAGNKFVRQGKMALAIVEYERARMLAPNDQDIATNLEKARTVEGLRADESNWFVREARLLNPNVMYWFGVSGLLLACACTLANRAVGGKRDAERARNLLGATMALGCGMAAAAVCDGFATWPTAHAGVVMQTTAARVSPVADGDRAFPLSEGQTVETAGAHDGYVFITNAQRQSGWVPAGDIVSIAPRA